MKIILFLLSFLALVLLASQVSACTPEYLCTDWGSCSDGIQTRTCQDTKCKTADVVERRLCAASGEECTPNYQCGEWSQCNYFGKSQDVISNKLRFNGYQERICSDVNRCGEGFAEERRCTDSFDVNFVTRERCGVSYIVALDKQSNKEVSTISANAWKQQRLDIAFVQSNFSYCPTCYNGVQDGDEENIDCGGSCKACSAESGKQNLFILIATSWIVSGLLLFAFFYVSFFGEKAKLRYKIYQAYNALENKDNEKLEKHISSIKKQYKGMKPEKRAAFDKDLEKLYRRI